MDPRWYEKFFDGIVVEMWRRAATPERTRLESAYLRRALDLRPGARVLDVPCGFGRHSLELASSGYDVTGVDLSTEMLDGARSDAAARGLKVEWRQGDMRDLHWESEFDAAFCFGNSFGYFDTEGSRAFLHAASRALKAGGRFVMDYGGAAESILPNLRDREWASLGDILFLEENRYDAAESCVETTYTFVRGGETRTQKGIQWVHTLREVRRLLDEAGLRVREVNRSLTGEPFEVGSRYLIVVAEKR